LGALSNSWGIVTKLTGQGYALTKTNANDVWLMTAGETDLGALNVRQGRLVFSLAGTTLGRSDSNVVVFPNAVLALATTNTMPNSGLPPAAFDAGSKPVFMQGNAAFESIGFPVNQTSTNIFSGPISITNNGIFRVGLNSDLVLNGPISGTNGQLVLTNNGTLILNGTNTYTSNTLVYAGTLVLSNAASLPPTNMIILSNNITTGNPILVFAGGPTFSTSNIMRMTAVNAAVSVGGDGTWRGPILMYGSNSFQFSGGETLLNLAGPLVTTNAGGSVAFHGSNTRVAGSLAFNGTVSIGSGDGLGAGFGERFTTVELDSTNNWTSLTTIDRGRINIGTNNALPPNIPIANIGTLSAGVGDRRVIIDLNGHNQTLSSVRETFPGNGLNQIGNSSTNSDSTLTYAGTATNTWTMQLVDTLDNPAVPHKLGLTVTSGLLETVTTNTYTGPTFVTGGKLLVSTLVLNSFTTLAGSLDATAVTVSGNGSFGGNGTVAGSVTIGSGGTLIPGDSYVFLSSSGTTSTQATRIGTLTMTGGNLTFASGSRGIFEVNLGAGTNDSVVGIGTLTCGGTLVISNIGTQVFANGNVLKLFDASSYVAGPVTLQPTSPGPGLMWDASNLAVDGTLRVVPIQVPVVSTPGSLPDRNIAFTINGVVGQGYSVLATTNVSLQATSWTVLQSGSLPAVPYVFQDLTATNAPARFYRVSSP
jgi:autotransporter-associated beta strand protein